MLAPGQKLHLVFSLDEAMMQEISALHTAVKPIETLFVVDAMLGQHGHFALYAAEKIPYAIERYTNEARRLYGVIDRRLAGSPWLGGREYSIADIATFPWLRSWQNQGIVLDDYPHLKQWFDTIAARPAVQRGVQVLADLRKPITDDKARDVLFGKTQYARR